MVYLGFGYAGMPFADTRYCYFLIKTKRSSNGSSAMENVR